MFKCSFSGFYDVCLSAPTPVCSFPPTHPTQKPNQVLAEVLPRWERQGHRVLLFAQTRQTLDILERLVRNQGWRYLRMDGATSVGARPALIDRFNGDESVFAFLLTTRTGGLGISLTGADRVVCACCVVCLSMCCVVLCVRPT